MENRSNNGGDSKTKIILFVIGVLIGAVISTTSFLVYMKTLNFSSSSNSGSQSSQQIPGGGGTPPEMPSGENGSSTPPETSSNGDSQSNN